MSAPVKFLAVAVGGWVTLRAAASALAFPGLASPAPAAAPAVPARPAPAASPVQEPPMTYVPLAAPAPQPGSAYASAGVPPGYALPPGYAVPAGYAVPQGYSVPPGYAVPATYAGPPPRAMPVPTPVYYPVPVAAAAMPLPRQTPWTASPSGAAEPSPPEADQAPLSRPVAIAVPDPRTGVVPAVTTPSPPRLKRLTLSSWSLVRQDSGLSAPTASGSDLVLATGGQLGGSQAGTRLSYHVTPRLAASLRFSAPLPTTGTRQRLSGEAALGVSWQPFATLPLQLMAERRQRVGGLDGGRNAFALLATGGIYGKPLPLSFTLDGYGQSGLVSLRQRDWFVDGGLVAERPLFGRYSAGLGLWGGAQKGLNRLDVGPRVSARLTRNIRLSVDYRYRAFGNAQPGSGFAVALGSEF